MIEKKRSGPELIQLGSLGSASGDIAVQYVVSCSAKDCPMSEEEYGTGSSSGPWTETDRKLLKAQIIQECLKRRGPGCAQ